MGQGGLYHAEQPWMSLPYFCLSCASPPLEYLQQTVKCSQCFSRVPGPCWPITQTGVGVRTNAFSPVRTSS